MIVYIENIVEKQVVVKYFNAKHNLKYVVSKNDEKTKGYVVCDGKTISFTEDIQVVVKYIELELEKEKCFTFSAFANILLEEYQEIAAKLSKVGAIVEHHCVSFKQVFKL